MPALRPTLENLPARPRRRSYPLSKAPRVLSAFEELRDEAGSGPDPRRDQRPKPSWRTKPDRPYWRDPGYGTVDWNLGDHHDPGEDGKDGGDGDGEDDGGGHDGSGSGGDES